MIELSNLWSVPSDNKTPIDDTLQAAQIGKIIRFCSDFDLKWVKIEQTNELINNKELIKIKLK